MTLNERILLASKLITQREEIEQLNALRRGGLKTTRLDG